MARLLPNPPPSPTMGRMYERFDEMRLKDGRAVECGVVAGPDEAWAGRVEPLLGHKGGLWNWQNAQALRTTTGLEARFYLLSLHGMPFANVCIFAAGGVGILGHVWTMPEFRRQGASTLLMQAAMRDFARRGGEALFLGTNPDGPAYGIYKQHGFSDVVPGSGHMTWYARGQAAFDAAWFAPGPTRIEPLAWRHWPASAPLFLRPGPGVVRCAPLRVFGAGLIEGPLLPAIQAQQERQAAEQGPCAVVLENSASQAVLGLAVWMFDPVWPATCVVDVFCHEDYWSRGSEMLSALAFPPGRRRVAYGDSSCPPKQAVLQAAGFARAGVLEKWLPGPSPADRGVDVVAFFAE